MSSTPAAAVDQQVSVPGEENANAIAMAKMIALQTNSKFSSNAPNPTTTNGWQNNQHQAQQFPFPPPPPGSGPGQPPRPPYGGFAYGGIQGYDFSSPMQPCAIPQIQSSDGKINNEIRQNFSNFNTNFTRMPPPQFQQQFNNFGQPPPWASHQQQQQQQQGGGPRPIRFSLAKKPALPIPNTNVQQQLQQQQNTLTTAAAAGTYVSPMLGLQQNSNNRVNYFKNSQGNNNSEDSSSSLSSNSNSNFGAGTATGSNQQQLNQQSYFNSYNSSSSNLSLSSLPNPKHKSFAGTAGGVVDQIANKQKESMDCSVWPDTLKEYVKRCFDIAKTNIDKDSIEIILKGKITRAANDGVLASKDWSNEPLPVIFNGRVSMLPFGGTSTLGKNKEEQSNSSSFDRGRGGRRRGGPGGRIIRDFEQDHKKTGKKNKGGRQRFRSRSPSIRSNSRSSSSSSHKGFSPGRDKDSKRRRRSSSDEEVAPIDYEGGFMSKRAKRRAAAAATAQQKKAKGKNKKKNWQIDMNSESNTGKVPHLYSEFGQVDGHFSTAKLSSRAARFANSDGQKKPSLKSRLGGFASSSNSSVDWQIDTAPSSIFSPLKMPNLTKRLMMAKIVGTCTDLEKKYLRLTSAPDSSTIRPPEILKDSLLHVQKRWQENQDYYFACDQLKAIRQDLTVQRIRDYFTVKVYETHARIALEKADHEEYNQCQSQLTQLYSSLPNCKNRVEFTSYRILYCIFTANTLDLGNLMSNLTGEDKENECIQHALNLRAAWSLRNYSKFFKLHSMAPKMSGYLIDWFANRERKVALKTIFKAYRPNVSLSFVKSQLGFQSDSNSDWNDFLTNSQLEAAIVYLDINKEIINAKESYPLLVALTS